MATVPAAKDKYRSFLDDEADNVQWRHGAPPSYDDVNQLFEQGRTKEWEEGSLEEIVQNAIKTWEMELSHKVRLQDFKSINHEKFKLIVNGREGLKGEEALKMGSYNALLKNSLPKEFQYYKADEESFESSHEAFRSAFPRGFAWEVIHVYSGPPLIAFKFRHWDEQVDEGLKVEEVEVYYDPAQLFGGLLKAPPISISSSPTHHASACPFHSSS
ncbi:hypothetical protein Gotri_021975 [Gossypium trilobum]|uniref:Pathogen-related protein n=1 Tax=Gossypium trilobum TaxID=34281 RepID=A0A7J9DE74_9ROSI|nr:hypothetical protein [Gossypium trilobum]